MSQNGEWDESIEESSNKDHTRLYIRNCPQGLNEVGLRNVFSKYGKLESFFFSHDPKKKYALAKYETAGEARLAMTKLNKTEPLKLTISVAYKEKLPLSSTLPKNRQDHKPQRSHTSNERSERTERTERSERTEQKHQMNDSRYEEEGSVSSSRGHRNGMGAVDDVFGNEMEDLDPDLELELERLRLQEAQIIYKQRLRSVELAEKRISASSARTSRSILPDGRIVVQNSSHDRTFEGKTMDGADGSGDTPPGLQRVCARDCVRCGARADAFCARCGVTPYCGEACQRADWGKRHRNVCHNLLKMGVGVTKVDANAATAPELKEEPQVAPLRRPRSPPRQNHNQSFKREDNQEQYKKPSPQAKTFSNPGFVQNASNFRPYPRGSKNDNRHEQTKEDDWGKKPKPEQTTQQPNTKYPKADQKPNQHATLQEEKTPQKTEPIRKMPQTVAKQADPVVPQVESKAPQVKAEATMPLVPEKCLIDTLVVGDTAILSLDAPAAQCRAEGAGYICLALSPAQQDNYERLVQPYAEYCESAPDYTPSLGETFSLYIPEDSSWYRARLVAPHTGALLDAARLAPVGGRTRALGGQWGAPEFSCWLEAGGVELGAQYTATITSRDATSCQVSLADVTTGTVVGAGRVARWVPKVDMPAPKIETPEPKIDTSVPEKKMNVPAPATDVLNTSIDQTQEIPSVPRPDLVNNTPVVVLDASSAGVVLVRDALEARTMHDMAEQGVAQYGQTATPLTEPPSRGDVVVARFSDGLHYRALVRRTGRAKDKYLLEYVEYANEEVSSLAKLYPCPPQWSLPRAPAAASVARIGGHTLTPKATEYLAELRGQTATVSLPNGATSVPSGSEVTLILTKNNENVNRKLAELCTPDWKKVEESNKTALDTEVLLIDALEYLPLPAAGTLRVLDASFLFAGSLSACGDDARALRQLARVEGPLNDMITEYCNSEIGREPYLPRNEELCLAQCPPYEQWFRAIRVPNPDQPADSICVSYLDYGNMCSVPLSGVRKMMPEFVRGEPALASALEINGLPPQLPPAALAAAREFLSLDSEAGGTVVVQDCNMTEPGTYTADCPGLIEALKGLI